MSKDVDETPEEPQVRPFAEFLVQQARGTTHEELSTALHDVVAAVRESGKAGTITLTLSIKPLSKGDDRAMSITDAVVVKMPKGERPVSVFFADDDGNLQRTDPRQMSLPLREVEDRRAGKEPKEIVR